MTTGLEILIMANQQQYTASNKKWLLRSAIILVCCVSVSQQFSIDVGNLKEEVTKDIQQGITNVAHFALNAKDVVIEKAHDLSPNVLGPIANALDPEWLLHMNYTRYIIDMEEALSSGSTDRWVDQVYSMLDLNRVKRELGYSANSKVSCFACKFVVNFCRAMMKAGKTDEQIANKVGEICSVLKLHTPRVCKGIINLVGTEALYVIRTSPMRPAQMCSFYLGDTCLAGEDPNQEWKMTFPPTPKPSQHPTVPPKESVPKLKVLQISDTHYDPYYKIGGNAECGEPLCCREDDGPPATISAAAGQWGDYRKCDAPKWLIENTFKHIFDTHKDIDYIMWTGDLPPHDSWNQTREGNLRVLRDTVEMVAKYFGHLPVFPSIGNHESCPVDSYPTPYAPANKNMSWLYDELVKEWGRWLPEETMKTVKRGAFYSVQVRPGLRIISVNGNYCNRHNFWLVLNSTDPLGQLAWLIDELQAAEDAGDKVHIIGHIPPGEADCVKVWSRNYYDIINRYEGTVMAQFYGHTHFDEFEVFYDTKDLKRPLNVGYIAPSVTPWEDPGVNPSYRIYYVDGDHPNSTRSIIDFETWKMDLDKANKEGTPVWYKAYTAREAYQIPSLLPKDWDNLIKRLATNSSLFDSYYKNYYGNSPVRPACNDDCRSRLLCKMRSGRSYDDINLCHDL